MKKYNGNADERFSALPFIRVYSKQKSLRETLRDFCCVKGEFFRNC